MSISFLPVMDTKWTPRRGEDGRFSRS